MKTPDPPVIETRVAMALHGDHYLRGYRVVEELLGKDSLFSVLSLALGGPRLTDEESRIFDHISVALFSADPRIWPVKIARMASSYGHFFNGVAAAILPMEDAFMGPATVRDAAIMLQGIRDELGSDIHNPVAVATCLQQRLAAGARLSGFGVVFRSQDERYVGLCQYLEASLYPPGPMFTLVRTMDEELRRTKNLPANMSAGMAALMLDHGYNPAQIHAMILFVAFINFLSAAFESAQSKDSCYQSLPLHAIDYQGKAPRVSPRAQHNSKEE